MSKSTPPEVEIRARELLAAEYERDGYPITARHVLTRSSAEHKPAIRAIVSALTPQDDVVEKRIIEWLRTTDEWTGDCRPFWLDEIADAIERGEHREAIRVGGGM